MLRIVATDSRARAHERLQVAVEQRDAGAFDRDVGSRPHGDADVGGGERRRVVDAVAGHGDDAALLGAAARPRRPCSAAGLPPRPRRCRASPRPPRAVVRLSPVSMTTRTPAAVQRLQRGRRRRLDRIGDADHAGRLAVDRDEDRRRAVAAQRFGLRRDRARRRPRARPETVDCRARRRGLRPCRRRPCRPARRNRSPRSAPAPSPGRRDDRRGERMLARSLEARRPAAARRRRRSRRPAEPRPPVACPQSACRSCRRRAYRPSPTAPAPRRP